jgi:hypothetical protein
VAGWLEVIAEAGGGDAATVGPGAPVFTRGGPEAVGRGRFGASSGTTRVASAVGLGAGVGAGALALGVGVGAGRRDSGTSGATGPWRSGSGCGVAPGRRKSVTDAAAGAASATAAADRAGVRIVQRIGHFTA